MLKVDHVTFVVKNLEEAINSFEKILQITPWENGIVGHQPDGRLVVLNTKGGARIELIEPGPKAENPMSKFLKERGEGIFGLSVFSDDFDGEVNRLKGRGVEVNVATQSFLFPEYPFRMGWVSATDAHGVAIEFVDAKALPAYENEWDKGGQPK
jgi:methylmalonyl-CoA/ethylmalonyl-CoA epimerase